MTTPTWNIADTIRREAELAGGYSKLEHLINTKNNEASWRPADRRKLKIIDRRKLKAIADGREFTVSTHELAAIDNYFSPRGEGFGDRPLFAKHNLLESAAENENFIALIGAFQRNQEERNDVSLWDVLAFREVLAGMQRFREVIHDTLEPIPFFNANGKHNHDAQLVSDLLNKSRRSICCIGSTRSNVAAECFLAEMFGVEPFVRLPKGRIPFKFFWAEDFERKRAGFSSAFEATEQEIAQTQYADTSLVKSVGGGGGVKALMLENLIYPVIPRKVDTWDDYGIVAVQRQSGDRVRIVLAGLTGPSTYACAKACRTTIAMPAPSVAKGKGFKTLWAVVRAKISPGKPGIGDTRSVESIKLLGEPRIWPCPSQVVNSA